MTIGERVAQLRTKKQVSQTALAREASIPLSTINMLEAGVRSGEGLSVRTARRIANALGVTLDFLCGPYEEETSEESPAAVAELGRYDPQKLPRQRKRQGAAD